MRVDVDEARRDEAALRLDLLGPRTIEGTDRGDLAADDGYIGLAERCARAVGEPATPDGRDRSDEP
jgi:hypothetical protein